MATQPKDLAETLKAIMTLSFGGKPNGRYLITRDRLASLAGRQTLREVFLTELYDEGLAAGIVIVDVGSGFGIQELHILEGYRSVPPSVLARLTADRKN
jgi:hypothetical protein